MTPKLAHEVERLDRAAHFEVEKRISSGTLPWWKSSSERHRGSTQTPMIEGKEAWTSAAVNGKGIVLIELRKKVFVVATRIAPATTLFSKGVRGNDLGQQMHDCDGHGFTIVLHIRHLSREHHATAHIAKPFPARSPVEVIREKVGIPTSSILYRVTDITHIADPANAHTAKTAAFEKDHPEFLHWSGGWPMCCAYLSSIALNR
ncbi:hypothetical protein EDD85DRAFT_1000113 [Armillaria nabsnona]|nr:hypothetical protein EDD85DRAFT_1000113 [Armillaria nabsnona]